MSAGKTVVMERRWHERRTPQGCTVRYRDESLNVAGSAYLVQHIELSYGGRREDRRRADRRRAG